MELEKIRPGDPMDDGTFVKYLRQGNVPAKLVIRGKALVTHDLRIMIQNTGEKFGGYGFSLHFGNYFNEHRDITSMFIGSGKQLKTDAVLCWMNPASDHLKAHAIGMEILTRENDEVKVKLAKSESKILANQFLNAAREAGQKIYLPLKKGAVTLLEISFHPIPDQKYMEMVIDRTERYGENDNDAEQKGKKYNRKFLQSFKPAKTKPDTNIIDLIKKATEKRGEITIDVTPVMAEDILMLNTGNRHVRMDDIFDHSEVQQKGEWKRTNQNTIGIDINMVLLDGQHKLFSQLKSGATIRYVIFCGLEPDAYEVIDTGRKRSPGDTLSVRNTPNANQAAASALLIISILNHNIVTTKRNVVTNHELNTWVRDEKNYRKLRECMSFTETIVKKNAPKDMLTHTLWTAMLFVLTTKHRSDGEIFMEKLATGEDMSKTNNSAIYHLRKMLISWNEKPENPKGRKASFAKVLAIIEAWNYYRIKNQKNGQPVEIDKLKVNFYQGILPKISR